jgi:competence protein ComEC
MVVSWLHSSGVIVIPVWQAKASLFQVTLLPTAGEPVLVIQDQGKVTLVNSGDDETIRFTVLPFLQQQGINELIQQCSKFQS